MIKLPEGTLFKIPNLKDKYDIGFLKGKIYQFIKTNPDNSSLWEVDGEDIHLDEYDSMFGFPWYLRQIYAMEASNANK